MKQKTNHLKNIIIAFLAGFLAYQMWNGAISIGADLNLKNGFGVPLAMGLQAVMWLSFLVLVLMVIQNLLEFFLLWKYEGKQEIPEKIRKLIRFTIYFKIYLSLTIRLVVSLFFVILALVAFFAPGVKVRGVKVYGAGIFMIALAAFLAYSNIRVAIARVQSLKGD